MGKFLYILSFVAPSISWVYDNQPHYLQLLALSTVTLLVTSGKMRSDLSLFVSHQSSSLSRRSRQPTSSLFSLSFFARLLRGTIQFSVIFIAGLFTFMTFFFFLRPLIVTNPHLSFIRIGHVESDRASFVVRVPLDMDSCTSEEREREREKAREIEKGVAGEREKERESDGVASPYISLSAFARGSHLPPIVQEFPLSLSRSDDFTTLLSLSNLQPDTQYDFTAHIYTLGCSSFFAEVVTTDADERMFGTFRTSPLSLSPTRVRIASSSCPFPWFWALEGFSHIGDRQPDRVFLLGDTIYADHPLFISTHFSFFSSKYRELFSDPHVQRLSRTTSILYMHDDHEVYDNYNVRWNATKPPALKPPNGQVVQVSPNHYQNAMHAWNRYVGMSNPINPISPEHHWYVSEYGNIGMFVLEVHAARSEDGVVDDEKKTMIGQVQKEALFNWLKEESYVVKLIFSPQTFTENNEDPHSWYGYKREREEIYNYIEKEAKGAVLLVTGDVHISGAFEVRPGLFEISASPVDGFTIESMEWVPHDRILADVEHSRTFSLLDIDTMRTPEVVSLELVAGGHTVFKRKLERREDKPNLFREVDE